MTISNKAMKSKKIIPASFLKNPIHFVSLGFGSGLAPKAPGTFGTIAAIPVYLLLSNLSIVWYLLATLLVSLLGIAACQYTSDKLNVHDHPGIVIDEIAGYLITMIAAPVNVLWIITGFILFRIFDILKPWPISWLDKKIHGGLGIMIDDIVAGIFALVCLQLIIYSTS